MIETAYWASDIPNIVKDSDVWIYGHSHYNTKDFKIGTTQMLTNQLGYVQRNENEHFDTSRFFTI